MIKRLRIKFVIINMVLVSIILGTVFGGILHITQEGLEQEAYDLMQELLRTPLHTERFRSNNDTIRLPYFILDINSLGIITATGGGYFDMSDTEYLNEVLEVALALEDTSGYLADYSLRYQQGDYFTGRRFVFVDVSSETVILNNLVRTLCIAGAITFTVFLGLSILLAFWAVHPIEQAWKQQKQFVSDASHELKTPLTVIMTNAEMLSAENDSPLLRQQFSSNILTMAEQMRGLVESLLELARMDNGSTKIIREDLNFSACVTDALLPFEPLFFEKGLLLESSVEADIFLHGSAPHLRQLTEILLDNAQKYSCSGGKTVITLTRDGRHCHLTVADEGDPIAPKDLKKIFQRFYRTDTVRSLSHSYGLGLSIAQSITELHNGKIHAESSNGVNSFHVVLPIL